MFNIGSVNKNDFGFHEIYKFNKSEKFTISKFTFIQDKEPNKSKNLKFIGHDFSINRSKNEKTDKGQNRKHFTDDLSAFKSHTTQYISNRLDSKLYNVNTTNKPNMMSKQPFEINQNAPKAKSFEQQQKKSAVFKSSAESNQSIGFNAKKPANPELYKLNGASVITEEKIAVESTELNPIEQQKKSAVFKSSAESNQSIKSNKFKFTSSKQRNLDGVENSNKTKQAAESNVIQPISSEKQNFVISHDQEKCQTLSNSSLHTSSKSKSNEIITKAVTNSQKVKFVIHNESFSEKPDQNFNSKRKSGSSVNDDRKVSHKIFNDVENEVNDFDFYCQPQILNQNQMMMLQQQQQQWFQMISKQKLIF